MIGDDNDLAFATVSELASAIRSGRTTPTRLAMDAIGRLETEGRQLNAVVTVTRDHALTQARTAESELAAGQDRGPLHGIPYGAKDLLATKGIPTTWGAEPYRQRIINVDADVVARLQSAGAVLVAKLASVEFAGGFGYEQPNAALTGPGRNAWNPQRWAGGSSSGSGAAVAAGLVPFAIGTETWGSITTPACFNGVVGLRPTYGRVSRRGAMALSWSMDKIGPITRTVDDGAMVLDAIIETDGEDPTQHPMSRNSDVRFAVLHGSTASAQPAVISNFENAVSVLRSIGNVDTIALPEFPYAAAASIIILAESASAFESFLDAGGAAELTASEDRYSLLPALTLPAVDYLRAVRMRRVAGRALDDSLAPYDAVVAPTVPVVAGPIDATFGSYFGSSAGPTLGAAGNLCGLPSVTVPNGFGEHGLPTGIEFMGRAFSDDRVIAAARAYQSLTDWHTKHPDRLRR